MTKRVKRQKKKSLETDLIELYLKPPRTGRSWRRGRAGKTDG